MWCLLEILYPWQDVNAVPIAIWQSNFGFIGTIKAIYIKPNGEFSKSKPISIAFRLLVKLPDL